MRPKPVDVLIFPDELHVADGSVNAFVERAMNVCAEGDYEAFRLLWSAKHEPLSREEFEQGWQAVQSIRVRALERAIVQGAEPAADGDAARTEVYLVLAEVAFDPNHPAAQGEANREVVLMMIREQDQWRLARATKPMAKWIREHVTDADGDTASKPTSP